MKNRLLTNNPVASYDVDMRFGLPRIVFFLALTMLPAFAQPPCWLVRSSKPDYLGIPRWAWGTGKLPPRVTSMPEPEYDEESKKALIQGIAVVEVELDSYGTLKNVRPVKSSGESLKEPNKCSARGGCPLPPALVRNALDNVRHWKFEPACKDGYGIPTMLTVEVSFHLY